MPRVQPEILRWARETAGLSLGEAARKINLREARGQSPEERLKALEEGAQEPSRPLLLRMAKQYRRPLITFYLPKPPSEGPRGQDFRTLPQEPLDTQEGLLDALLRDIQARQSMVRNVLEDEEETQPLPFIGSMHQSDGVKALVQDLRTTLGLPLDEMRKAPNASAAFKLLRSRVEAAGIFVLLIGNLGNYRTNLSLETFRGLALADPIAPFIVINDQDSRAAWSFTLLHELTHLWLGQTGVSNRHPQQSVEKFCNDVASEFLLPGEELRTLSAPPSEDLEHLQQVVTAFAREKNLSSSLVAYRLLRARAINHSTWQQLSQRLREHWLSERERRREKQREGAGAPDYYVVRQHRLGKALTDLISRLITAGEITTTKASKVLGIKAHQVGPLLARAGASSQPL